MEHAALRGGWAVCPVHQSKLCRLEKGAVADGIILWCKLCRGPVRLSVAVAPGSGQSAVLRDGASKGWRPI